MPFDLEWLRMCAESAMGRGVQICVCPCFQQCQASHTYSISILIGMEKTDSYSITDGLARDDAAATILILLITMNNITQFQCLSNNIVFFYQLLTLWFRLCFAVSVRVSRYKKCSCQKKYF